MIFKSQSNLILNYVLIIGILLVFAIAFIVFARRKANIKFMVPVCAVLIAFIAGLIFNSYHYGIKKIVFPIVQGDNEYTARTEIEGYLKWLNSLELEKVEYDSGNDPGMQSGNHGCEDVVYNNGDIESYIHSSDYMLVVKGKEKQLYRIIE